MPTETRWEVPKRVIYTRYFGNMTMEDIVAVISDLERYLEEGIPLVHTIMDVGEVETYPNLLELTRLKFKQNDRQGWTIFVGAQGVARFAASVTSQLAGSRFRLFDTFEEAVAFLNEQDDTLGDTS
ncbi:MAG: hypothetical protein K8J31_18150 [Anaerolineae bacterium]|nr:hypothetical protein [Anaerolineae bacterium]